MGIISGLGKIMSKLGKVAPEAKAAEEAALRKLAAKEILEAPAPGKTTDYVAMDGKTVKVPTFEEDNRKAGKGIKDWIAKAGNEMDERKRLENPMKKMGKEEDAKALARFKETGDIEGVNLADLGMADKDGKVIIKPRGKKNPMEGEVDDTAMEGHRTLQREADQERKTDDIGLMRHEGKDFSHKGLVKGTPGRAEYDKAIKAGMDEEEAYDLALEWLYKREQ
jgi:hypothetical protein